MAFNKDKLKDDFLAALSQDAPADDDAVMEMLAGVAQKMADGVELNPAADVISNTDRIKLLEDDVESLKAKVDELKTFVDEIEQRLTAEEGVTANLKPTALNQ